MTANTGQVMNFEQATPKFLEKIKEAHGYIKDRKIKDAIASVMQIHQYLPIFEKKTNFNTVFEPFSKLFKELNNSLSEEQRNSLGDCNKFVTINKETLDRQTLLVSEGLLRNEILGRQALASEELLGRQALAIPAGSQARIAVNGLLTAELLQRTLNRQTTSQRAATIELGINETSKKPWPKKKMFMTGLAVAALWTGLWTASKNRQTVENLVGTYAKHLTTTGAASIATGVESARTALANSDKELLALYSGLGGLYAIGRVSKKKILMAGLGLAGLGAALHRQTIGNLIGTCCANNVLATRASGIAIGSARTAGAALGSLGTRASGIASGALESVRTALSNLSPETEKTIKAMAVGAGFGIHTLIGTALPKDTTQEKWSKKKRLAAGLSAAVLGAGVGAAFVNRQTVENFVRTYAKHLTTTGAASIATGVESARTALANCAKHLVSPSVPASTSAGNTALSATSAIAPVVEQTNNLLLDSVIPTGIGTTRGHIYVGGAGWVPFTSYK